MAAITAKMVGDLRAKTDAPMMECKKALTEAEGDMVRAEEILRVTASQAGEKAVELRARIQDRLRDAKVRLQDAEAALVDKTKAAARATDDFVHENPWQAVGVAAALGLALGVLIGRR